jgi:hypothetical protein
VEEKMNFERTRISLAGFKSLFFLKAMRDKFEKKLTHENSIHNPTRISA